MDITKTKNDGAEVMLSGTLPASTIITFYEKAVEGAVKEVSLPGFRKGHVPKERVIEEVGKNFLWKDAAERALQDELETILKEQDVSPIAPLSVSLKNPEFEKDVAFEIHIVTPPTVTIEDYKGVAKKALAALPKTENEKEEKDAVRAFRTQVRAINKMATPEEVKEGDAKENEDKADEPLSDEEAKQVGFENAKAAEHFIGEEAKKAVADRDMQKRRGAVAEALIEAATCEIPKILITDEAKALLDTFRRDVAAQGMQWSDYLKRVGKTEVEVEKDLYPNAEKRIALDLIFGHIVREEKFELTEDEKKKEEEFAHKLSGQGVEHSRAHVYAHEQFLREKVWVALGITSTDAVS